jgi:L-ascorbate metabolism protein UlaG (beta-lactamase superfamily)
VIAIDAYVSPSDGRNVPPLFQPSELTNADAIIGTHDHGDHIDRPSWPELAAASPKAVFVVPAMVKDAVMADLNLPASRVAGLDDGLSTTINEVKITAVPAAHELLVIDPETGFHECLGVVLEGNGFCLYHAGDTCIYEGIQARLRNWSIDLAFLPINGRDAKRLQSGCIGNMTFQEAVDLAGAIKPGLVVPTHFEMFDGNTENPELFMDYIRVKYPQLNAQVPIHGELTLVEAAR